MLLSMPPWCFLGGVKCVEDSCIIPCVRRGTQSEWSTFTVNSTRFRTILEISLDVLTNVFPGRFNYSGKTHPECELHAPTAKTKERVNEPAPLSLALVFDYGCSMISCLVPLCLPCLDGLLSLLNNEPKQSLLSLHCFSLVLRNINDKGHWCISHSLASLLLESCI